MGGSNGFWHAVWIARFSLLSGLATTAELSVVVIAIGTILGLAGGLALQYGPWPVRMLVRAYVDTMRGIPVLVLILASYYGLALVAIQITPFEAGVVALGGFCSAHMSETVRGATGAIPLGQIEAARAIGLSRYKRLYFVILPLAIRRILPPWVNTAVEMVKASSLLAIIGVVELLLATQQVIARTYMVIPFYLTACVIYFGINFVVAQLGAALEARFAFIRY
jgi:polar amino acid transport system permease protein